MPRAVLVVQLLALSWSTKLREKIEADQRLPGGKGIDWTVDPDISGLGFAREMRSESSLLAMPATGGDASTCVDMTMWSRGFARECCDLTPKCLTVINQPTPQSSWLEGTRDTSYWQSPRLSQPGVTVYVPFGNLPAFVSDFLKLPSNASVTLVTGQEDFSAPREIWGHEGRQDMTENFPINYTEFIKDPRLKHWFTQNYDLTGCNPYSGCSKVDINDPLVKKVSPIPIGVDFHTMDEKSHQMKASMQMQMLEKVRQESPPLSKREDKVLYMPFTETNPMRADAIHNVSDKISKKLTQRITVEEMWRAIGTYRYVACPFGHGLDTHRLWEVLRLGSIPVVTSSSLDRLFEGHQLPAIIVDDWKSVNETSFAQWNEQIVKNFGPLEKLSAPSGADMRFWFGKIRATATADLRLGVQNTITFVNTCETGRARDEWKCQ